MANIVCNWIVCKDKRFNSINEKELLKRYHEAPGFLNSSQVENWNSKYKGVNHIHTNYFENNTLCFDTKWKPISYEIIKELSRDFEYCLYEWIEENGIGAKILFYKGEVYKEYEYSRYCLVGSKQDEELDKLWSFDKCKADKKAENIMKKKETPKQDNLPF